LSGLTVYRAVFEELEAELKDWKALEDGASFRAGDVVASFSANTRCVLTGERCALNFVQHLSGVATLTSEFVRAIEGLNTQICDTRKTTPMLRALEKEAVVHGGGRNHRHGLNDGVLIKDNHIAAAGGIEQAIVLARAHTHHLMKIEVEVTNAAQLEEAIRGGADVLLLDNMSNDAMREAVTRAKDTGIALEASGNATLGRIREMAETGVDFISVGALTHSAKACDLSLNISPH
jgi:nicotinate-nucleotide pyrophosphorylase (carboxylating)